MSSLPEINNNRTYKKAAPVRRALNHGIFKLHTHLFVAFVKPIPAVNHLALRRCNSPDLACFRPRLKISVILVVACLFNKTSNSYLSFQLFPEKNKTGFWIFCKLLPFVTFIVCEEHKTFFGKSFEQHCPGRGHAI